jgi:flagellar motor switch protein FliG
MMATETVSGIRKAAILLLSLGEEQAAGVLRHLSRDEVDALTLEIANLRRVDRAQREAVTAEFVQILETEQYLAEGGIDYAKAMLEKAFDTARAGEILHRLTSFLHRRPLEVLRRADAGQVLAFLTGEHPQTIALVLAHMDPTQASMVLSGLEPAVQADVARRIATMGKPAPELVREIEQHLERRLSTLAVDDISVAGGINAIVPILNNSDRSTERQILEHLAELDPALAEEIQNRMFVFENIVQLDDRSVQKVLRHVDSRTLAMALKGTSSEVSNKVFANLSQKAAELLRDDIAVLGPVRIRDVEAAQREVVNVIRQLEDAGEIVIARGERDEFVV